MLVLSSRSAYRASKSVNGSGQPWSLVLASCSTTALSSQRRARHSVAAQSQTQTAQQRKPTRTSSFEDPLDAIVVGAGPAGIAVIGNLLDQHQHRNLWIDHHFESGRIGAKYREVPSNTKVKLFLEFAKAVAPFQHILDQSGQGPGKGKDAAAALRELEQDKGCKLSYAVDLCGMLTRGVERHFNREVWSRKGAVVDAVLDKSANVWDVTMHNQKSFRTRRLVLCTGASPISSPPSIPSSSNMTTIPLDTALKPSILAQTIDPSSPTTIAVVGASHSAILVLMNLYKLASSSSHPNLRIKWFTRHKELKYAKEMDGWILYDNTGLKGEAAQWARENLEEGKFESSPVSKVVDKLWTPTAEAGREEAVYAAEMPECTHMIQAIGYQRDPLPNLSSVAEAGATPEPLKVEPDSLTGRFFANGAADGKGAHVPGLFGAGIAFPERVTDPAGHVEHAVGMWKFMKFCKRVVPEWIERP